MASVSVNYRDVIELLEHLGEIVKHEREERGVMYREAAAEIGISHGYLWALESGQQEPTTSTVVKLLRWLERG